MELREAVKAKSKELDALQAILAKFPNAKSYTDRWGHVYYTTPDIPLDHPDLKWEWRRSCGCCIDAAYQISLYLEFDNFRIHPEGWYRRTYCYGNWSGAPEFESDSIRSRLTEQGLSPHIVDSAIFHLERELRDYEDEEE